MDIRTIDATISVAGQIKASDVEAIAKAGFRSIICNRPDGEGLLQPACDGIEQAAKAAGLEFKYQPVQSGAVYDHDVKDFEKAIDAVTKPVLAYCRTGTRCTVLWSLSQANKRDLPEILSMASDAGYDMSGLTDRIIGSK
jgi:sulfide:quinone oxidoreductase